MQAGFADEAVAQLVGIDGVEELPLVVVQLGGADLVMPPVGSLDPPAIPSLPVATRMLRFPLVDEAHAAGVLTEDALAGWREAARAVSRPAPTQVDAPAGVEEGQRIEDVILKRGSTRVFRPERGAAELLDWALPAAARAVPLDVAPAGTLIEHLLNVHGVEGAEPGGYRYTSEGGFEAESPVSPISALRGPICAWASPSAATPPTRPSTPWSSPRCLVLWGPEATGPRSSKPASWRAAWRSTPSPWGRRHRAHLL